MLRAPRISWFSTKRVIFAFAGEKTKDLDFLAKLMEDGKIKSIIDRQYPLEEAAEAHRYVELGQKTGHVIINIAE
jgi:NADPH:quinone reductase-like Zn-dependent oxidoreductase